MDTFWVPSSLAHQLGPWRLSLLPTLPVSFAITQASELTVFPLLPLLTLFPPLGIPSLESLMSKSYLPLRVFLICPLYEHSPDFSSAPN